MWQLTLQENPAALVINLMGVSHINPNFLRKLQEAEGMNPSALFDSFELFFLYQDMSTIFKGLFSLKKNEFHLLSKILMR